MLELLEFVFGVVEIAADCRSAGRSETPAGKSVRGTIILVFAGILWAVLAADILYFAPKSGIRNADFIHVLWCLDSAVIVITAVCKAALSVRRKKASDHR